MEAEAVPHLPPDGRSAGPRQARDALAEGLMLMRASNLSIVRLQLAVERRDRHCLLETIDDLAGLDRKLRDLVHELPVPEGRHAAIERHLEIQGAVLAREKLALTSGILRRGGDRAASPTGGAPRLEVVATAPDRAAVPTAVQASGSVAALLGPEPPQTLSGDADRRAGVSPLQLVIIALLGLAIAGLCVILSIEQDRIGQFLEMSGD